MMQLTFRITKEKEKELFRYIEKECNGYFLCAWSETENFQFDTAVVS